MTDTLALRERLRLIIAHVAQQAGARKLCRALAMAEGSTLQIAVCNSPRASAALQLWLEEAVADDREERVRVERFSPYPLDFFEPGPESVDADGLGQAVLNPLLARASELARALIFIDAAAAPSRHGEAWRALFLRLNERRNLLARELAASVTLVLPPWLETDFARLAPDAWSVRSVAVEVRDLDEPITAGLLMQAYDLEDDWSDLDALKDDVERARKRLAPLGVPGAQALHVLLLKRARALRRAGAITEATATIEEASDLAARMNEPGALTASRLALSDVLVIQGDLAGAAKILIDEVIPAMIARGDEWGLANARGRLADVLELRGELHEALRIRRDEELPIYRHLGDARAAAMTMAKIASIALSRGDLDEALRILSGDVMPIFEHIHDLRSRAVTMGRIADVMQARGAVDEALRIRVEEELPIFERLGDVREKAATLGKIARIHRERGDLAEALRIHTEEELPIYEHLGDVRNRALTLGSIAHIYRGRGHFDDALRIHQEEELPIFEKIGDAHSAMVTHSNIAVTLFARGRREDQAAIREHLYEGRELARRCGYSADISHVERLMDQMGVPR